MSLREPGRGQRRETEAHRLVVDFIACDGWGICADLLPDHVELDDWGYPILVDDVVLKSDLRKARKAIGACPALAMRLEEMRENVSARR